MFNSIATVIFILKTLCSIYGITKNKDDEDYIKRKAMQLILFRFSYVKLITYLI